MTDIALGGGMTDYKSSAGKFAIYGCDVGHPTTKSNVWPGRDGDRGSDKDKETDRTMNMDR